MKKEEHNAEEQYYTSYFGTVPQHSDGTTTIIASPAYKVGVVPTCSPCHVGALKLAVLGNCYNTYVAKALVSLWKCDFETLDRINRNSG